MKKGLQERYKFRLRAVREMRGYKRAVDFAQAAGLTQAEVSKYERGHSMPSVQQLCHIADVLAVRLDDLIEWPRKIRR